MSREKQIEEILKVLKGSQAVTYEPNAYPIELFSNGQKAKFYVSDQDGRLTIDFSVFANDLYNADFRKQSEGENITEMHPVDEFICSECGLIMRDCCRYEIDADDGDEICYEFAFRFCPRCGAKMKGGAE